MNTEPLSNQKENKDLEKEFADIFGGSSMSDDDLLKMVDKHTLQLDGEQILSLLLLRAKRNPVFDMLCDHYIELKHHNHSGEIMIQALGAVSLRKFISQFRFNINTTK